MMMIQIFESDSIKQYLINCLLYSLVENMTNLNYIMPQCDLLIQILISSLEKCNNVIKVKMILLLGFCSNSFFSTTIYSPSIKFSLKFL